MPLAGGATAKFGDRYEGRWTVACLLAVLDEVASAIRLEPPGEDGEGAEFWLETGGFREYHQVKRQRGTKGNWSLADLAAEGVLTYFANRLTDSKVRCVFTSTHAAGELQELSERARGAASWQEFETQFLSAQKVGAAFEDLRSRWGGANTTQVYDCLRRVFVRTVDEATLCDLIYARSERLVDGDPELVCATLAQFVLDRVHHEITAYDIWSHLDVKYPRRNWSTDPRAIASLQAATDRYIENLRGAAFGAPIPRAEASLIVTKLSSTQARRAVLVAGEGGIGKSGVLLQVIEQLKPLGWPVLGFRVDRLTPQETARQVGLALDLPGSPGAVLASVAKGRNCLMVIDQLDAVSLTSGRHPDFFDCIYEVIRQALKEPNVRILLACRAFDLHNDSRLRRLSEGGGIAEVIPIQPLSANTVRAVVRDLGLDPARLTPKQLELFSVPLHLKLLADVWRPGELDPLYVNTAKELMDRYWDLKQQDLRVRLGRPVQWTGVIDALLECMDDKQILSAPLAVVDVVGDDARAMVSEHVLMQEGQRYSFFHESFFDYAFARRFAGRNRPLIEYLKAREQHLFRRAQLRQILVYERQADRPSYLSDLALLLNDSGVRFHLKQVAVALLGTFSDPSEDEFSVLAQFILVSANPLSKDIWLLLQNSVPWFRIADAAGLIESWLCGTDELADRAVMVLTGVQAKEPDRVAHLLDAYSAGVGRWRERLLWMIPRTNPAASPSFFHLLLRLLDSGTLDGLDFLSYLYQWPEHQLDLAAEAVARWASRRVDIGQAAGEMNPFRVGGRPEGNDFGGDRLTQIAMHAPGAFVRHVLPVLEQIAVSNLTGRGAPPRPDRVWLYRERGLPYTVEGAFLQAAELALTSLLQSDPTQFSIEAARLQNSDSATLQFLLIRAYAAVAESGLADDALRYLSGDQRRLSLGYASDLHRPARDLIVTASTLGSADVLAELEHVLLDYYSASETSEGGRASVGYVQYRLLSAIDQTRLSEAARQRVEQWTSKFGQLSPELAEDDGAGGFVGSPIAEQEAAGLTDMQWIEAVGTYCDDSLRSVDDAGKVLGGMYEAAETLAAQAKIQPARFAALALEFPRGTHTAYYGALLRSLRDAPMTVDQVLGLVRLTHGLPDRPLCQPLCDFIGGHAELELPDEVWGAVLWYAQQPPHQEEDEWLTDGTADAPIGDRIQMAVYNSARCVAIGALARMLWHNPASKSLLTPVLSLLRQDPSVTLHAALLDVAYSVLRYDRESAVSLFLELADADDRLLATRGVDRFLHFATRTHFVELAPLLERMLESSVADVIEAGGRHACFAALMLEAAQPLAERVISGSEQQRLGAARIYAANLCVASLRGQCETRLTTLFEDASERVRAAASQCFVQMPQSELDMYSGLMGQFILSPAFVDGAGQLLWTLFRATVPLPAVTCRACARFVDMVGEAAANIATRAGGQAFRVSELLVRAYGQSIGDAELERECLDVIDRVAEVGILGIAEAISKFER